MTNKETAVKVVRQMVTIAEARVLRAERACVGVDPNSRIGDADHTPAELLAAAIEWRDSLTECLVWIEAINSMPTRADL